MADQQALSQVLRKFARTMANTYDLTEVLHDLSANAVEVLGATAAGVALLHGEQLRFVTATSDAAVEAERVQERLQAGACMESIRLDAPVAVPDLREQPDRWPDYAAALEDLGFRAVLGLPLVIDDRRVGSLDAYSTEARAWDEDAVEAARVLADIAAAYVLNATDLADQRESEARLRAALDGPFATEQAKGVLAERLGITVTEAFERLRAEAHDDGIHLAELARRVIDDGHTLD